MRRRSAHDRNLGAREDDEEDDLPLPVVLVGKPEWRDEDIARMLVLGIVRVVLVAAMFVAYKAFKVFRVLEAFESLAVEMML